MIVPYKTKDLVRGTRSLVFRAYFTNPTIDLSFIEISR